METHNKQEFSRLEYDAIKRGYKVTDDGLFYGVRGNIIKYVCRDGYVRTSMKVNGKNKMLFAHRVQAFRKYGDKIYTKGLMVRHLDGNKSNNHIDNIALGSNKDNAMDRSSEERLASALNATKHTIKYNKEEVISYHIENGKSYKKTKERFGISSSGTLHYILKKRKINEPT